MSPQEYISLRSELEELRAGAKSSGNWVGIDSSTINRGSTVKLPRGARGTAVVKKLSLRKYYPATRSENIHAGAIGPALFGSRPESLRCVCYRWRAVSRGTVQRSIYLSEPAVASTSLRGAKFTCTSTLPRKVRGKLDILGGAAAT